ncbi:MAG: radical SAM protein [bacterium]
MEKKKVVLIEPASPGAHIFSRVPIPRLGIIILGTIAKQAGYEVKIYIEDMFGKINDLKSVIEGALAVGISTITSTAPRAYQLADQTRALGITVILGGVHPTFMIEEALNHADFVVRGEGEKAILPLLEAISGQINFSQVPNLSYWQGGQIMSNEMAPHIVDLDEIPSPDYSVIEGWQTDKKVPVVSITTSRGCPFNCVFCSVVPMFGRRYRFTSVERAVADLEAAAKIAKHIFIADDNFTANIERVKAILKEAIRRGLKFEWSAQVRTETAKDKELLRLMKQTGCFMNFIGFESINPKTLVAYEKKQTLAEIEQSIKAFQRFGIKIHGMFVLGADEDEVATIKETVRFAKRLDIDTVQFMILTPLPGTRVWQEFVDQARIIDINYSHYDAHHTVYKPKRMTSYELQIETFRAMKKFYSWRGIFQRLLKAIITWSAPDFWIVNLRFYGRKQIRQAFESKRLYLKYLHEKISQHTEKFKANLSKKRIKTVGLPAELMGNWEPSYRRFLRAFLAKLGVKIIDLKADQIIDEQPDIVLLAHWAVKNKGEIFHSIKDKKQISLDFNPQNFSEQCLGLGLLFKSKVRRVRRIFQKTLQDNVLA